MHAHVVGGLRRQEQPVQAGRAVGATSTKTSVSEVGEDSRSPHPVRTEGIWRP